MYILYICINYGKGNVNKYTLYSVYCIYPFRFDREFIWNFLYGELCIYIIIYDINRNIEVFVGTQ